jgi:hypothetical protein
MNRQAQCNRFKKRITRVCNAWLQLRSQAEYIAILHLQVRNYESIHGPIDLTTEPVPPNNLRTEEKVMREYKASFPEAIEKLQRSGVTLIDPDSEQGKRLERGPWIKRTDSRNEKVERTVDASASGSAVHEGG